MDFLFLLLFFFFIFESKAHVSPCVSNGGNTELKATKGHELELKLENIGCPRSDLKIRRHFDIELNVSLSSSKDQLPFALEAERVSLHFPGWAKKN